MPASADARGNAENRGEKGTETAASFLPVATVIHDLTRPADRPAASEAERMREVLKASRPFSGAMGASQRKRAMEVYDRLAAGRKTMTEEAARKLAPQEEKTS